MARRHGMGICTHPTKTSRWRSKTSRYDLQTPKPSRTGAEPPRKQVEPPRVFRTAKIIIRKSHNFLLRTPFLVILDFPESLFQGLSNPTKNKPQNQQVQVLCHCISLMLTLGFGQFEHLRLVYDSCCIPLDSMTYLYSRSREYNHFSHLSLQYLHMSFLLNISS